MRAVLFASFASLTANLLVLSAFIPVAIGFRPVIILQIAFWTFFAAIGAAATMFILQKFAPYPAHVFVLLAFLVFFLSLIPIYLHAGILHDFPYSLTMTVVEALVTMHIVDSLTIGGFVFGFAQYNKTHSINRNSLNTLS